MKRLHDPGLTFITVPARASRTAPPSIRTADAGHAAKCEPRSSAGQQQRILRRRCYHAGYASNLDVLDAQRSLFATELDVITVRDSQLDNVVGLYKALGGGWSPDVLTASASGTRRAQPIDQPVEP